MSKVTDDLQVTIPRAIAERYGIAPGDEVQFVPAGDAIHLVPAGTPERRDTEARLRRFDEATERQLARERERNWGPATPGEARGWTREDLYYDRGWPRGGPR